MQVQKTNRHCLSLQLRWIVTKQKDGQLVASHRVLSSAGAECHMKQISALKHRAQRWEAGPTDSTGKKLLSVPLLCSLEQWLKPTPEGSQVSQASADDSGGGWLPLCQPLQQMGMERRQCRKALGTCGLQKGNNSVCRCWFGGTRGGMSTGTCSGQAARSLPAAGFGWPSLQPQVGSSALSWLFVSNRGSCILERRDGCVATSGDCW